MPTAHPTYVPGDREMAPSATQSSAQLASEDPHPSPRFAHGPTNPASADLIELHGSGSGPRPWPPHSAEYPPNHISYDHRSRKDPEAYHAQYDQLGQHHHHHHHHYHHHPYHEHEYRHPYYSSSQQQQQQQQQQPQPQHQQDIHRYQQRGHRYSTDSAAADTLLMLSAAAFMDAKAAQAILIADDHDGVEDKRRTHEHSNDSSEAPTAAHLCRPSVESRSSTSSSNGHITLGHHGRSYSHGHTQGVSRHSQGPPPPLLPGRRSSVSSAGRPYPATTLGLRTFSMQGKGGMPEEVGSSGAMTAMTSSRPVQRPHRLPDASLAGEPDQTAMECEPMDGHASSSSSSSSSSSRTPNPNPNPNPSTCSLAGRSFVYSDHHHHPTSTESGPVHAPHAHAHGHSHVHDPRAAIRREDAADTRSTPMPLPSVDAPLPSRSFVPPPSFSASPSTAPQSSGHDRRVRAGERGGARSSIGREGRVPAMQVDIKKANEARQLSPMDDATPVVAEEDDEEDEVMSEGVVHVNARLAPFQLAPSTKRTQGPSFQSPLPPLPPSISTSLTNLAALPPHGQPQLDSPRTPTSARTPRTPKAPRTPKHGKAPRLPKRSQSYRDSSADYFYSPFPPNVGGGGSGGSPTSSPSSPSAYQSQLQQLTHNFVSVQPHASPTNRFRRIPSSFVPSTPTTPFSPPASPGPVDMTRDSMFNSLSIAMAGATGSQSAATTPTSATFPRSGYPPTRAPFKPRWHTQPYMMFLALRAMPDRTAARQELIMAAVELDKRFSAEKGLPRVFTGKTPMNSASACLTNNGDKYFIPFKPEGSRSTHFRLAYQPGDFDTAVAEYHGWMEQLIKRDWPLCFGVPKNRSIVQTPDRELTEAKEEEDEAIPESGSEPGPVSTASSPETRKRSLGPMDVDQDQDSGMVKKVKAESDPDDLSVLQSCNTAISHESGDDKVMDRFELLDIKSRACSAPSTVPSTPTTTMNPMAALEFNRALELRLKGLDLSHVPTGLWELVRVDRSTLPNAGQGLFAKMDLPAGTPLGFYFGVPMTENEFDSLKDGVGQSSQYSIMYRRTVLDATDEQGQAYSNPEGPLYCPFHFMNEALSGNMSFITGSVVNQVICTTNRDIKAGEELLLYYGRESERHWAIPGHVEVAATTTTTTTTTTTATLTATVPMTVSAMTAATTTASTSTTAAATTTSIVEGEESEAGAEGGMNGGGRRTRAGTRSRPTSPVLRNTTMGSDEGGRPRRESVYKPVRYTR